MELDQFSNASFLGMEMVPLIFDDRLMFSELIAKVCDELQWNSNEEVVSVEGVLRSVW